jgi:hypothetical protein
MGRPAGTGNGSRVEQQKALVVYRHIVTDQCMYLAFFACATGRSPSEENGFFDNFEIIE